MTKGLSLVSQSFVWGALVAIAMPRATFAADATVASPPATAPAAPPLASPGDPAAEDQTRAGDRIASDGFEDSFIVDSARIPHYIPLEDFVTFSLHGEYALRFRVMRDLRLENPVRDTSPEAKTLGQNAYLYHWLRLRPRIDIDDTAAIVAQVDVPRGLFVGDTTRYVTAARDDYADPNWYDVHPRELYVEVKTPIGLFRAGQQLGHWGLGLLANDGDHPQMFGDTNRGSITERLLFATRPFGPTSPFLLVAAGDLVFEDNTADLLEGEFAVQGVLAAVYRVDDAEIGLYGVARHQWRAQDEFTQTPFTEKLTVGVLDAFGKYRSKVPGTEWYLQGSAEAALIFGSTDIIRTSYGNRVDPTRLPDDENILSFGSAVVLSLVHATTEPLSEADRTRALTVFPKRYGDMAFEVEWGYASGDANPYDGTTHRFTFDPNHNVGLVLFDHTLAWKTARSATIAQDPRIVNRPPPGLDRLPSNGGVFGATYVNPRAVVRPKEWIDLKLGFVFAQSTTDVVDPYQAGALGSIRNYDGGDSHSRDLGIEIDTGFDLRIPLDERVKLEVGAEGGILFPGHAFDDAIGRGPGTQYLLNNKLGLAF